MKMGLAAIAAAALIGLGASPARAEPGVAEKEIVLGQVAALAGPASALGNGMRTGLLAAFGEANAAGGIHGRTINLVSRDDSYEPEDSAAQTRRMAEEAGIFALIGPVGTPTSKAAQPIAQEAGIPFIGPFTGAGFLRDPALSNVINVRASYDQETEEWIKHLVEDLGIKSIAILHQDDSFGQAGLSGVQKAMDKRGMSLTAAATYPRNTTDVKPAVDAIVAAKPEAVVMVGAYAPVAAFIGQAKKAGLNALFLNISFVGSEALADTLGPIGEGVVITQVVPFPWDSSVPVVRDYQAALKTHAGGERPGFVSLEGYLVGRLFLSALEKAGPSPTREALMKAMQGTHDLGGFALTFGPGDNQGSDRVYFTVLNADGSFLPVTKLVR
ncbi:ABC transporter substrate-binding protein [Indioceanicola profundi]|uniref:ABC transporter substrate-binding protein n=1 Tax=Indioceanicola profundi TaxID=2220096 RepID=UPI001969A1CF|nr:ABC transporter substrate-binding protein [Indioceanicola profundi]